MKQVAYLQINKYRALYNDVVIKSIQKAGIVCKTEYKGSGKQLLVAEKDYAAAAKIVLGVSYTNPKYHK